MTTELETSSDELARIAEDAYLFGFPIVLMEVTRRITTNVPAGLRPGFGPMNLFTHMQAFPPGDFKEVVRPNFDTLYSILWFDLRDEPLVISVPPPTTPPCTRCRTGSSSPRCRSGRPRHRHRALSWTVRSI